MSTAYERERERGDQIQHRLVAAAKSYAADPASGPRFDELMAAGVAFGRRSDLEHAAEFAALGNAIARLVRATNELIAYCDHPEETCVRCKEAIDAVNGVEDAVNCPYGEAIALLAAAGEKGQEP